MVYALTNHPPTPKILRRTVSRGLASQHWRARLSAGPDEFRAAAEARTHATFVFSQCGNFVTTCLVKHDLYLPGGKDFEAPAESGSGGRLMHPNRLQVTFTSPRRRRENATGPLWQPVALSNDMVERAAKALFDSVFSSCGRLDWTSCDESTKGGFRREATAVIDAVWPDLVCVSSYQRDGIADSMIRDTGRS